MADAASAVKYSYSVILDGGPPWGIRLQGGHEFAQRLRIAKVNPNSKAYRQGVQTGDQVDTINGVSTDCMNHRDALRLFQNSNGKLVLELTRTDKQSAIPIFRVESPAVLTHNESDLERVDSFELLCNENDNASDMTSAHDAHGMTSAHDDVHLNSDHELTSHGQSSAVIWSPSGYNQMKTYQPVEFDLNSQNRRVRTRNDNSAASKGSESADEILISKSFPIPVKTVEIPGHSHPSGKRRHPRHVSDPGFDSKQSLRPPISDFIQLSRRSRQFNYWNHFYPRNFSDPAVLAPKADPENSPSIQNSLSRPPVFASTEEFQKHYGSCYARTLPLRKRYTVRPAPCQNNTPSSSQVKRVQFAPHELQPQPLFYDSDDATTTFPRVANPRRKTVSSMTSSVEPKVKLQNESWDLNPLVLNSPVAEPTSSDPGQLNYAESVTSSLKVNLNPSSDEERTGSETKIFNRKFLKSEESVVKKDVNSSRFAVDGVLTSNDLKSLADSVDATTARLQLVQSEKPKPQGSVLTLLKKNQETTCNALQPQTIPSEQPKASKPSTNSIQLSLAENQPNTNTRRSNITSIWTTSKAKQPVSSSANFSDQELLDFMGDMSGDYLRKTSDDGGQKDWYKKVFNTLHRVEQDSEFPAHPFNAADKFIPPRPKTVQTKGDSLCNNQLDEKNREKTAAGSTQGGITEIAPCGIRYVSKPDRECQKGSFHSNLPAAVFRNEKEEKQPRIATENRMLSPRLSDPTLIRDRSSCLFDDDYWLELAGLGKVSGSRDQPLVSHSKAQTLASNMSSATSSSAKAIALYSFKAKSEKELSFNRGDIICIIRPIDKNWYEAQLNGSVGLVPCSYVKVTNDVDEKREKALILVKAKHNFTAKFPAELSFNNGDIITVIRRIDDNWYEGRLRQQTGIFPVSYVEPVSDTSVQQTTIVSGISPSKSSSTGNVAPYAASHSGMTPTRDAYNDTLQGLNKDVLEFDRLFENHTNFNGAKTDQKPFVSNNEQNLTLPNAKWTRTPVDTKFNTISISSSIKNPTVASNAIQNPNSVHQKIQSEPRSDAVNRSATPSLHLLYEEPWFQVLYNYTPQHDDELDLCEGDLIYLLESCDDGWCVGQSDRTKRIGTFPGNYVKQLG